MMNYIIILSTISGLWVWKQTSPFPPRRLSLRLAGDLPGLRGLPGLSGGRRQSAERHAPVGPLAPDVLLGGRSRLRARPRFHVHDAPLCVPRRGLDVLDSGLARFFRWRHRDYDI